MSAVVLDSQSSSTPALSANRCVLGGGGLTSTGAIIAGGSQGSGSVFLGALTIQEALPAVINPTTSATSYWTTYAADQNGGGLAASQLQKFAYTATSVSPQYIQQYENGGWVPTATTVVPPNIAADAVFINRAELSRPLDMGAPLIGSFTCAAAPVVVPCAGITLNSYIRIFLLGGTTASFAAAVSAPPALTIQVGATTAASTFTATGGEAGMLYGYEVLRA
jgi:hypothetical protein